MAETINGYSIYDYSSADFEKLKPDWQLLEKGADMTAFQSYTWYDGINALHNRERTKNLFRRWRYIVVRKGELPLLIAPLEIKRCGFGYKNYGAAPRGVYFIGRMGHTDYLNFVYDRFDPDAAAAMLEYVAEKYRQKRVCFDRMLENTESYRYLCRTYAVKQSPEQCAALMLPESFEEYRTSLSKSTRQNIRTAVNRAKRNGLELVHELVLDEGDDLKEELLLLSRQRDKKKKANSKKEMSFVGSVYCFFAGIFRKLFTARLDVMRVSKNTFCFLVKDGERIVSYFWGIRNDYLKEYYVILVSVDPEYEWYSPNISHLYLFLEEYFAEGREDIRLLDFTRGAEGYKKTIGCTTRPVSGIRFRRS